MEVYKTQKVLNHGHVTLVDKMGDDDAIVAAARCSYGKGTKTINEDRGLIRYLMRHWHTTPFEMCEIKLHVKMPIFVARQWHRHRTASINEVSARYSEMKDEFYIPDGGFSPQSSKNKQGSDEQAVVAGGDGHLLDQYVEGCEQAFKDYSELLVMNASREQARMGLPVSTYTEFYWKVNLHNLFHFLRLRLDSHAQYEIRVYAEAIAEMVKELFPVAWEAFVDYRLNAVSFSKQELEILRDSIDVESLDLGDELSVREKNEFLKKMGLS